MGETGVRSAVDAVTGFAGAPGVETRAAPSTISVRGGMHSHRSVGNSDAGRGVMAKYRTRSTKFGFALRTNVALFPTDDRDT